MSDELIPCPFCGGPAQASLAAYASGATAHVVCDGCGAKVLGYGRGERGLRDAVKRWNRRAERTGHYVYDKEISAWRCSECSNVLSSDPDYDTDMDGPTYCEVCGHRIIGKGEPTWL